MLEGMITQRQTTHCTGFRDVGGMIRRHHYFEFQVNSTQTIGGQFSTVAGKTISVDWGDGGARSTYSGTNQAWSKDYGSAGDRTVRIFGSVVLTKFMMSAAGADISFDLADLPAGVTYVYCTGSNTVFGDIGGLPRGVTEFYCLGNCVITGDVAGLPATLQLIDCNGSNTISGDIGDLPAVSTYVKIRGSNTISDYTTKLWTTKPGKCIVIPTGAGGLSTAEVDQLLIDLDADCEWVAGNAITLTGANAARSAASNAAVASMEGEGATVTTN